MGDVFDQALGQALRKLRTERGWSQSDLALRAQMDRNYLSLIELGCNSPSVRMLVRLCSALDVNTVDVLADVNRRMQVQRLVPDDSACVLDGHGLLELPCVISIENGLQAICRKR